MYNASTYLLLTKETCTIVIGCILNCVKYNTYMYTYSSIHVHVY